MSNLIRFGDVIIKRESIITIEKEGDFVIRIFANGSYFYEPYESRRERDVAFNCLSFSADSMQVEFIEKFKNSVLIELDRLSKKINSIDVNITLFSRELTSLRKRLKKYPLPGKQK